MTQRFATEWLHFAACAFTAALIAFISVLTETGGIGSDWIGVGAVVLIGSVVGGAALYLAVGAVRLTISASRSLRH